jgi:nucleoside-diphosphate-sugar epimerase
MDGSVVLLTGFPAGFVARRVLAKLLASEEASTIICLTPKAQMQAAENELQAMPQEWRARVELCPGDVADMDFGMSGAHYLQLARRVDVVHHCAFISHAGVRRDVAERINVGGTGEVLELCEVGSGAARLVLWSTVSVSGRQTGRVEEGALTRPARFASVVEETRSRAEQMVREAMDHVPTTILRPSIIVGDSVTGEMDRLEGPYLLILLMLNSPIDLRVPLPGRGDTPLNLVPIDYVVDAGHAIASDPRSIGRTFHIVDEHPMTARRVFELIAEAGGRPGPVGGLPNQVATALLRTPGLERFSHIPRAFLEQLATDVVYDARNASELLAEAGITCPRATNYLPNLVAYVRRQQHMRGDKRRPGRGVDDLEEDPLS